MIRVPEIFRIRIFGAVVALCVVAFLADKVPSQKNSEPKLVQKYTEHFCESGRSSIDLLLSDLLKEQKTKGVIVLHPSASDPLWPYKEKAAITNLLNFRRFDAGRIEIVLGEPEMTTSTELWILNEGAASDFKGRPWDLSMAALKQPMLVHSRTWTDGIGCGLFEFSHEFFAALLRRNENLVGRVVVREVSSAKFEIAMRRISEELLGRRNKIWQKQLEFAYLKDKNVDTEYWLLPSDYVGPFQGN